jgi:hypothetical protein
MCSCHPGYPKRGMVKSYKFREKSNGGRCILHGAAPLAVSANSGVLSQRFPTMWNRRNASNCG